MNTFKESNLNEEILSAVADLGFEKPTPIQEKSIEHLLNSDDDLIALAQTGTGKTAAFSLPLLHKTDLSSKKTQTIILCPTRELCLQISKDIESYSKYMKGFRVTSVYGGASIDTQIRDLNKGSQFVVGTPGRTVDLIKRKKLRLEDIKHVIMDEADEMLSMGFKDDLDAILEHTPETKQTLLYSATMPKEIAKMARKYMTNAVEISVANRNESTNNVSHEYYVTLSKNRYEALKRIVDVNPDIYGIIFCRTRRETKEVADKLSRDGYNSDATHGDLSQAQRDSVMERFRAKRLQLLVATDVAARGIDVSDLTHVINYNLPDEIATYVHRSGRTGRAHKKGIAMTIINTRESNYIRQIERKISKTMELKQIPTGEEICEKQLFKLIKTIDNIKVDESQIDKYMDQINKELENLSREDLIKKIVSVEFNRFIDYYKNTRDINATLGRGGERDERRGGRNDRRDRDRGERSERRDRGDRSERRDRGDRGDRRDRGERSERRDRSDSRSESSENENFARFHINLGETNNLDPKELLGLINENISDNNIEIGKIDILNNFSFFEVKKEAKEHILESFKDAKYKGMQVRVEPSKPRRTSFSRSRRSDSNDDSNVERKRRRSFDDQPDYSSRRRRR